MENYLLYGISIVVLIIGILIVLFYDSFEKFKKEQYDLYIDNNGDKIFQLLYTSKNINLDMKNLSNTYNNFLEFFKLLNLISTLMKHKFFKSIVFYEHIKEEVNNITFYFDSGKLHIILPCYIINKMNKYNLKELDIVVSDMFRKKLKEYQETLKEK